MIKMKKTLKKLSFIILLFVLVTSTFYFAPTLVHNKTAEPLQNSFILSLYNKAFQQTTPSLEKEYSEFLSKTISEEINKIFPLLHSDLIVRAKISPLEKQSFLTPYEVIKQSFILIVSPAIDLSESEFKAEKEKLQKYIFQKTGYDLNKEDYFKIISLPFQKKDKTFIKKEQLIGLILIVLFIATIFFYIVPKLTRKKKFKKTYKRLSSQTSSLREKENSEIETLLKKVQSLSSKNPTLFLKNIRINLTKEKNKKDQTLFSPAEQTAILLLLLDEKTLKKIFKRMTPTEVKIIQEITISLGHLTNEDKKQALTTFLNQLKEEKTPSYNALKMHPILPIQQIKSILKLEDISLKNEKDVWTQFEQLDETKIASFLENEYPQTSALILYHLKEEKTASILNLLPLEKSSAILWRLANLKHLTKEKLKIVESTTNNYFFGLKKYNFYQGTQKAALILSLIPHLKKEQLINLLETKSAATAKSLLKKIIRFNDIKNLDKKFIKKLIKKIPTDILSIALLEADNETKKALTSHLLPKEWAILMENSNKSPSNDLKRIDEAQCFIIKQAQELMLKQKTKKKK